MTDIIFYEAFLEEQDLIKKHLPPFYKVLFFSETVQESGEVKPSGKLLCIRTQSTIPEDWHDKIEAVLTRSQGYDHLIRMFKNTVKPPQMGYLGEYCSRSVAEHAIMCMFGLTKKLKNQIHQFLSFDRDGLTGFEIFGRKTLVVGVGQIGEQIVRLSKALNMNVKGVDIVPNKVDIEYVSLKEGLKWAEIIFCALPLTHDTTNYFNYQRLKMVNNRPFFINISRGEISPVDDLLKLLNEGLLSGVSLDVYQHENIFADELRKGKSLSEYTQKIIDFSKRENVICTPHNAFNTEQAVIKKTKATIQSLESYLNTGRFPHPVIDQ